MIPLNRINNLLKIGDSLTMGMFRLKLRTSSLFCSFLLYFYFITISLSAQEIVPPNIIGGDEKAKAAIISNSSDTNKTAEDVFYAKLEDIDGDTFLDAVVETNKIKVVISSKNGGVSSYYLKGKNFEENIIPPYVLGIGANFEDKYKQSFVTSLTDYTFDNGYNIEIEEQNDKEIIVKAIANIKSTDAEQQKVTLSKKYTFNKNGYNFIIKNLISNISDAKTTVGNDTLGGLSIKYGPGLFMKPEINNPVTVYGLTSQDLMPAAIYAGDIKKNKFNSRNGGAFKGVGLKDLYFCVAITSNTEGLVIPPPVFYENVAQTKQQFNPVIIGCETPKFTLEKGETKTFEFDIYAGPMNLEYLTPLGLKNIPEHGFLSNVLMSLLHFFYSLIPDYGIAIILLTVLVRIIVFPLNTKQMKSMYAMQKLAPKMQDIKDRYKDDPQKMNEEMLKFYQKNNINPMSGCLPMLLQMPILIALYNTIRNAVELRKTSFLWLPDLSQSDPYIILPIAIAVLMYLQSATTQNQQTADPAQKQMMLIMPMMMFMITWSLPAGLLVYWFASSILGILQQQYINLKFAEHKEEKKDEFTKNN